MAVGMRRGFLALAAVIVLPALVPVAAFADDAVPAPSCSSGLGATSAIGSNFNGTAIAAGRTIWFNSVLKVSGLGSGSTTIRVVNQSIRLAGDTLSVPDSVITFSATATAATASFDAIANAWHTTVPTGLGGNTFLSGVGLAVATGLPGGINPVSWQGAFFTDTPGVSVHWQWAAAVYTAFGATGDALAVKPTDDRTASVFANSDHAGTPENFRQYVTGGARGGGGSNWTGSYSATASVTPCLGAPDSEEPTAT